MTRALLLDLDGTLLENDLERFMPVYLQALTQAVAPQVEAESFVPALGAGVQAMLASTDGRSNEEVFWAAAAPRLGVPRATLEPLLEHFYEVTFADLRHVTAPVAGARELVASVKGAGWKVALATNPVFPRRAIEHRLRWAGLEPERFDLITDYATMHSTKPHARYFREVAERLGLAPKACLMAGNHLADDLVGAQEAGMKTYFVDTFAIEDAQLHPDGRGSLIDLRRWLFG